MTERRPNQPFSSHTVPPGYEQPTIPSAEAVVQVEKPKANPVIGEFFGKYQSSAEKQPRETRKEKLVKFFSESCVEDGILSGMVEAAQQLKAHNEEDVSLSINPHLNYSNSDPVLELFWNRQLKTNDNHTYYRQKRVRCEIIKGEIKIFRSGKDKPLTLKNSSSKEQVDQTIIQAISTAAVEIDTVANSYDNPIKRQQDKRRRKKDEEARLYLVK